MAALAFFDDFKRYFGNCVPDQDIENDQWSVYLSDDAPVVATDTAKADVIAITEQNGYTQTNLTTTWVEVSGDWVLRNNAETIVWTASGGSFGPFRYAVLINNTTTTPLDLLAGYWDHGSSVTITDGNSFTIDLNATFDLFSLTS